MKNQFLFLIAVLLPLSLTAQTVDPRSQKLIDDYIKSHLFIEADTFATKAAGKVFTGNFYKVTAGFQEEDGTSSCGNYYFNINEGLMKQYEGLHSDMELPGLFSLLRKDFLLKDESGALLFEAALNELYPVDEDEKATIRHFKKGEQWIFIRNKFFDDYTAIIVTAAAAGAISKIEVKLGYAVN